MPFQIIRNDIISEENLFMGVLIYLITINLAAFTAFGIDKWKAVHKKWRISELALMGMIGIGGSVGGLFGMHAFRHKTRKPMFRYGVPLILVLHIAVVYYLNKTGVMATLLLSVVPRALRIL